MISRRRYYLIMISIPVVFFVLFDLVLRLAKIDPYEEKPLPREFLGSAERLYNKIAMADGQEAYVTEVGRSDPCRFQPIPVHKPENAYFIFIVGGSAPGGFPYSGHVAFSQWLKAGLETVYPENAFHMVNASFPGVTLGTVALIVREMLEYQPDVIIVYSGNNEQRNLEEGITVFKNSGVGPILLRVCWKLRSFQVLHYLMVGRRPSFDWRFAAVDAKRQTKSRSTDELPFLLERYKTGLRAIHQLASKEGVPVLFCTVPVNEKDWPPYESVFSESLPAHEKNEWMGNLRQVASLINNRKPREAREICRQLLTRDSRYALAHYFLGKTNEQLGLKEEARRAYQAALDSDQVRLRAFGALNHALVEFCEAHSLPVADCVENLRRSSSDGLLGYDQFLDNCHLKPDGHRTISGEICRALIESGPLPKPPVDWKRRFENGLVQYERAMVISDQERAFAYLNTAKALLEGITFRMDPVAFKRAEELLKLALTTIPEICSGHFYLGVIYFLAGDPESAGREWRTELRICPRLAESQAALDLLDSGRLSREALLHKSLFNLTVPGP